MDIYLVRVSERPDKSLFIERKPNATTNDDYIAISHVWGTPETIQATEVDGVPGTVWLSPGKKDILSILRRESICGDSWFWMDLFCIDQTQDASISIADQLMAIPAIYKSSRCVKVLIETPVCDGWQTQASRVILDSTMDADLFAEEETRHARKCPHMLFCDPWFERLWTRQEGLYGSVLEVIILNPVTCSRLQTAPRTGKDGWIAEGAAPAKRTVAKFFFSDKIAYHGIPDSEAQRIQFPFYLDFVYRHRIEVKKYGGQIGPAPSYSPITEAWRSNRITTKPRDYVLAVFPDIAGYQVPVNARKMPFHELITDALGQATILERFRVASKVPKGLISETSSKDSPTPWILNEPSNIGEAFDSFIARFYDDTTTTTDAKFFAVAQKTQLEKLDFNKSNISGIQDIWSTTADVIKHMTLVSPSGPCTGTTRSSVQTEQGLLHQYFVHQLAPAAVMKFLPKEKLDAIEFATKGMFTFEEVGNMSDDTFSRELRRFLVSLICGTSLHTADVILKSADFRIVSSEYGKLLSLIRRDILSNSRQDILLLCTTLWPLQGFLVGVKTDRGVFVVGRTVVPTSKFWDSMEAGKAGN
ncbi:hypothetical protein K435DRAFT_766928 [Dendrothele bispora CBS 962.96]|uniref:Heterokaryon incompatibility domain-containing protein n=1 Tax=Dendrothele bispora (strain CBS 962.96) TaxID=1314807 RepID=A0A4S8L142_DENBC|nr:hypothetical protein K435DRAFT_766928 [Dendrothele bispora CBS 962.96]